MNIFWLLLVNTELATLFKLLIFFKSGNAETTSHFAITMIFLD